MLKRLLLIAMMTVTAAFAAQADYLYWQINSSDVVEGANYACVCYVTGGSTYSAFDTMYDGEVISDSAYSFDNGKHILISELVETTVYIDVSDFESASGYFYIEMVNWDAATSTKTVMAMGEKTSYSDLSGSISGSLMDLPTAWTGGEFRVVPEPTSGMLLLFGLGVIALRRRRSV